MRLVAEDDTRIGVSTIDIKNSQHDRIGLAIFSELIFHAYALRFYFDQLENKGENPLFYVRASGNLFFW